MFVQVVINAQGTWTRATKDRIAVGVTDAIRSVTSDDTGEVSVWFEEFGPDDVFVGAHPALPADGA